jgi:hypothetical protein
MRKFPESVENNMFSGQSRNWHQETSDQEKYKTRTDWGKGIFGENGTSIPNLSCLSSSGGSQISLFRFLFGQQIRRC